jgi:hypothetical protein
LINQKIFYVQQNKFGDKEDYLVYKDLRMTSLAKKRGILMLGTVPVTGAERVNMFLNNKIDVLILNSEKERRPWK